MTISASLDVHRLPEILQFLGMAGSTGFLTVTAEGRAAGIAFRNGRILYARTTDSSPLGQRLVEVEILSPMHLEAVLIMQRMKKVKQSLGTILLELGLASRDELEGQIAQHTREIVGTVMSWDKGSYRFEPLEAHDSEMLLQEGIEVDTFLLDAVCDGSAGEMEMVA